MMLKGLKQANKSSSHVPSSSIIKHWVMINSSPPSSLSTQSLLINHQNSNASLISQQQQRSLSCYQNFMSPSLSFSLSHRSPTSSLLLQSTPTTTRQQQQQCYHTISHSTTTTSMNHQMSNENKSNHNHNHNNNSNNHHLLEEEDAEDMEEEEYILNDQLIQSMHDLSIHFKSFTQSIDEFMRNKWYHKCIPLLHQMNSVLNDLMHQEASLMMMNDKDTHNDNDDDDVDDNKGTHDVEMLLNHTAATTTTTTTTDDNRGTTTLLTTNKHVVMIMMKLLEKSEHLNNKNKHHNTRNNDDMNDMDDDEEHNVNTMNKSIWKMMAHCQLYVHYNLAYAYFQQGEFNHCVQCCNDTLEWERVFDQMNELNDAFDQLNRVCSLKAQALCERGYAGDLRMAVRLFSFLIDHRLKKTMMMVNKQHTKKQKKQQKNHTEQYATINDVDHGDGDDTLSSSDNSSSSSSSSSSSNSGGSSSACHRLLWTELYHRCTVYVELNQLDDALKDAVEMIKYDPLNIRGLLLKARIQFMISQSIHFYHMEPSTVRYHLNQSLSCAHFILQILIIKSDDNHAQTTGNRQNNPNHPYHQYHSNDHSQEYVGGHNQQGNDDLVTTKRETLLLIANIYAKLQQYQLAIDACQLLLLSSSVPPSSSSDASLPSMAIEAKDHVDHHDNDNEIYWDALTIRASCYYHLYQFSKSLNDYDRIESHNPLSILEHGDEYGFMLARLANYDDLLSFVERYFNVPMRNSGSICGSGGTPPIVSDPSHTSTNSSSMTTHQQLSPLPPYAMNPSSHVSSSVSSTMEQHLRHNVHIDVLYGRGQYNEGLSYYNIHIAPFESDYEPSLLMTLWLAKMDFLMRLQEYDCVMLLANQLELKARQYNDEMILMDVSRYRALVWAHLGQHSESESEWNKLEQIRIALKEKKILQAVSNDDSSSVISSHDTPFDREYWIQLRQSRAVMLGTRSENVSRSLKQLDALVKEALQFSLVDYAVDILNDIVLMELANKRGDKAQKHIAQILFYVPEHTIRHKQALL